MGGVRDPLMRKPLNNSVKGWIWRFCIFLLMWKKKFEHYIIWFLEFISVFCKEEPLLEIYFCIMSARNKIIQIWMSTNKKAVYFEFWYYQIWWEKKTFKQNSSFPKISFWCWDFEHLSNRNSYLVQVFYCFIFKSILPNNVWVAGCKPRSAIAHVKKRAGRGRVSFFINQGFLLQQKTQENQSLNTPNVPNKHAA